MQQAYREASGNVVLRSGPVGTGSTMRFFHEYGGTPLEMWKEPYAGPVLNPFLGSALSLVWDTGQDPTQASAEGLLRNPIARLNHPGSVALYNYYIRETHLDAAGEYGIAGFFPIFWLSHEAIDDSIRPAPNSSDHGWRTFYHNPQNLPFWSTPNSVVAFRGTNQVSEGKFYPGDQMAWPGLSWNERICEFPQGRVAAKIRVRMDPTTSSDARAGFIFKENVNDISRLGFRFYVTKLGVWTLANGSSGTIGYGKLSKTQLKNLTNQFGVNLELRTHNGDLRFAQLFIDGGLIWQGLLPGNVDGPHFGLYARSSSGMVYFHDRQVFDVAVQARLRWRALPNEEFQSEAVIERAPGAEQTSSKFYRAGIGAFLNPLIFKPEGRVAYTINLDGSKTPQEGLFALKDYSGFYVGNETYGVAGFPVCYQVDDKDTIGTGEAHVLTQKQAINNEFYMGFNPLAVGQSKVAKQIRMVTKWRLTI